MYNFFLTTTVQLLRLIGPFNPKTGAFLKERKQEKFPALNNKPVILVHCASLGEYEQGASLIKELENSEKYDVIVSFFSPSGYTHLKKKGKHKIVYLPLDTKKEVSKFLDYFNPKATFFIKYEFWPNILRALNQRGSKIYSVSSIFKPKQFSNLYYSKLLRNSLQNFSWFFVQDETSKKILQEEGITNITVTGDTRFDRVLTNSKQKVPVSILEQEKNQRDIIVFGSTWPKDEEIIAQYIQNHKLLKDALFVIVPHHVDDKNISRLTGLFKGDSIRYDQATTENVKNFNVLIINEMGLLKSIYYYSDIAYIGGGFQKTGIHNLLEAAVYAKPIIIGPRFNKYNEAIELNNKNGLISITDTSSFTIALEKLLFNKKEREQLAKTAKDYVQSQSGATKKIVQGLKDQGFAI